MALRVKLGKSQGDPRSPDPRKERRGLGRGVSKEGLTQMRKGLVHKSVVLSQTITTTRIQFVRVVFP